jgi:uncharacterized membrane protein YraQ (UPF0718 family)
MRQCAGGRRLLAAGAPLGTALGFLFAAPVLNPIVLASTWAAFPDQPWLLAARPLGAVLISLGPWPPCCGGCRKGSCCTADLLEERRMNQPLERVSLLERRGGLIGAPQGSPGVTPLPVQPARTPLREVLGHATGEFLDLALLLVMGCAIAALVQTLVPRAWLLAVGGAPTLSILSLMLLSLVVSVCSSVDAFLALGFAAQVTPGAVLAFLLLGPVIDLKLIGLFGILFQPRAILVTAAGRGAAGAGDRPVGQPVAALTMWRALSLALWGSVLLQSAISGRLDLLLRAVFHPLVWISGRRAAAAGCRGAAGPPPPALPGRCRPWTAGAAAQRRHRRAGAGPAAPGPPFADLAANRDSNLLEEPALSFVLHRRPSAASPTGCGLLRSEPDPSLHAGGCGADQRLRSARGRGSSPSWPA